MCRCACALALLCAALAHGAIFKRAEMSSSPFVLSSRYGRSSPRIMSPRNDRFFLTGRYGKRSAVSDIPHAALALRLLQARRRERDRRRSDAATDRDRDTSEWRPRYPRSGKRTPELPGPSFARR